MLLESTDTMPGDLTKADIPGFAGGGSASTPSTMLTKTWQMVLGFLLVFVAVAVALGLAVRALAFGNRNLGTGFSLPASVQPSGGSGAGGLWEGV